MNASLVQSLHSAAVYTFEQLVFLLPEIPPDEIQRRRPVSAVASVEFTGPAHGLLQVYAGEGLLPRLTANMLGTETAPETLQLDALGEIANIICGQVLPALHPARAFEQRPPLVVSGQGRSVEPATDPSARVELGLESSRAELRLYLYDSIAVGSAS